LLATFVLRAFDEFPFLGYRVFGHADDMENPRNSNTLHILVNVMRERLDRRGGRMPKVIEEEEEGGRKCTVFKARKCIKLGSMRWWISAVALWLGRLGEGAL
jgi:hypothetical protein